MMTESKTGGASGSLPHSSANDGVRQPEADTGHDYTMPIPEVRTGRQFCQGVIGPATLSAAVSRIAVDKATDANTRQFANFELREALAVTAILQDLNTPIPPMSAAALELLETIRTASAGAAFDKTYMTAQLANHEFLRDLAEAYLQTAPQADSAEETHGRHLAALAITAFKEHVVLAKNIVSTMGA